MSIAWSEGDIAYTPSFEAVDTTEIIDQIHAHATVAGWGSSAIAGGFMFTLESKQGLVCKVKVVDSGSSGATVQFHSFDETKVGYPHFVPHSNGVVGTARDIFYRLHVNRCQIFLAEVGRDTNGWAMQGGIPFIPDIDPSEIVPCTEEIFPTSIPADVVTQAFWSAGQHGDGGNSFRWSHYTTSLGTGRFSALFNDDLMDSSLVAFSRRNGVKLHPLKTTVPDNDFFVTILQRTRHYSDTELLTLMVDPLIGWGSSSAADLPGKLRGQIYDGVMPTLDTPLDFDIENLFGTNWFNYLHGPNNLVGSRFGSLLLAKGQPTDIQEAYIY